MQHAIPLGTTGLLTSRVGIGGHYRAIEEGCFEERTAWLESEISLRCRITEQAVACGIRYFDTTWRNESELLGRALALTGLRDRVTVNGMVLGCFTGPAHFGLSPEAYLQKWLDERLRHMPDHHFDTFMLNAIEEGFDEAVLERLIPVLERHRDAGDFSAIGFSTHRPSLARQVLDRYPVFRTAMIPYNYHNRAMEEAFDGYCGDAALIAMKPLVWAEYGVPFCALNNDPQFRERFGFDPDPDIAIDAFRFILSHPCITGLVCAVNSEMEVRQLAVAREGVLLPERMAALERYRVLQEQDGGVPLFRSALRMDNLRANYFGAAHLARILGRSMPDVRVNAPGARERILAFAEGLMET